MNRIILSTMLLCAGTLVFGQQQKKIQQNGSKEENSNVGKADITKASIYNYTIFPQTIDIARHFNLTPEQGKANIRNSIAGIIELVLPKPLFAQDK